MTPQTLPHRSRRFWLPATLVALAGFSTWGKTAPGDEARGRAWPLHVIDASSRGADGVRLADANGDGLMDIATGWEEGGITRVYLHPGHGSVRRPWPAVTVGRTPSVEDAVLVDLDGDGRTDVVSCCEGRTRRVFVHWAPHDPAAYLDPNAWQTRPLPAAEDTMMWMFCLPIQVDGRGRTDLVAGGKGPAAQIGWFEAPEDPRRLDQWQWHPICPAGWIMSLRAADFDGDGDLDVITTDRKGPLRGCRWLENPGPGPGRRRPWRSRFLGGREHEVMFMDVADLDGDGTDDVLVAAKPRWLLLFRGSRDAGPPADPVCIPLPKDAGTAKAAAVGEIDSRAGPDVVVTCEGASEGRSGVLWLSRHPSPSGSTWSAHEISGPVGIKYDRAELIDVDRDGDLDVLTCEESEPVEGSRRGLGVFWYENPVAGG